MAGRPIKLRFEGAHGAQLAARLEIPTGPVKAYALFSHCFTCTKDLTAARKISEALTVQGIAVLRFDFTGLGGSGGDFASTNFTSNLEDLRLAADYLRREFEAPKLLIGHSLGGAAVLAVAESIPEVTAIATIGAPADVDHVTHNFEQHLEEIGQKGHAKVTLGGRYFVIKQHFVEDLRNQDLLATVGRMRKALLLLHAPRDETVGIENAQRLFEAAKHPKSFVSLDSADHLLRDPKDATYAADVIGTWAKRYVEVSPEAEKPEDIGEGVIVRETALGKYQAMVMAGTHRMLADEPVEVGGMASGPSPYEYLSAALGACTVMTLRMYADHKQIALDGVAVRVTHEKIHANDCAECGDEAHEKGGKIDLFERVLTLHGDFDDTVRQRLIEIADKCPVHRTLEHASKIVTRDGRDL